MKNWCVANVGRLFSFTLIVETIPENLFAALPLSFFLKIIQSRFTSVIIQLEVSASSVQREIGFSSLRA
jgi:hypothetical protein